MYPPTLGWGILPRLGNAEGYGFPAAVDFGDTGICAIGLTKSVAAHNRDDENLLQTSPISVHRSPTSR